MVKKIILAALMMIMLPTFAGAGVIIPNVATGTSTGTITPSGSTYAISAKTYTLTAVSGYTINYITDNGITVPNSQISGSGPWTYVVPLNSSTQTVFVYFKSIPVQLPTVLIASAPSSVNATLNTPQTISGSTSTISNLQPGTKAKFVWTSVPAVGAVFSPISSSVTNPSSIITSFTAGISGMYAATLTLSAPGAASSTANVSIYVQPAGVAGSNACLTCHSAWPQAIAYATSTHATIPATTCQGCHDPAGTGTHPYNLNTNTVSAATFTTLTSNVNELGLATGANFCTWCHTTGNIVSAYQTSMHYTTGLTCSSCHIDPHTAKLVTFIDCVACHTTATPQVVSDWLTSPHAANGVTCVTCHAEHAFAATVAVCLNCHSPHPWPSIGICNQCHNVHSAAVTNMGYPHFSTYSTAQYVTTNITCNNCHTQVGSTAFNVYSANYQWAASGKANPTSPAYIGPGPYTEANLEASDFKNLGTPLPANPSTTTSQDCVRCHTSTGFVNYVTPLNTANQATAFSDIHAWGTPGDRTREMIACTACHNNSTGFDATFSRRTVGIMSDPIFNPSANIVQAWYGYSSASTHKFIRDKSFENITNGDMADSNICIVCHTGTSSGDIIQQQANTCASVPSIACRVGATGSFWSNVNFIDPHNMNPANLMFTDGVHPGYEYVSGTPYSPAHNNIGFGPSQFGGPCVGCHMTSPNPHSFSVTSSAGNGTITAIRTNICSSCHGTTAANMDAPTMQAKMTGYQAALSVIAAQLANYGIYYNPAVAPYFYTSANPTLQTNANQTVNWYYSSSIQGANLMGAAFNLRLLQPGTGWVHNSVYSKRLLYDTINYLDNGQHTSVSNAILSVNVSTLTQSNAIAYIVPRP